VIVAISVLTVVSVLVVVACAVTLLRRIHRSLTAGPAASRKCAPPPPPYGALPSLGPVGVLGELSPDADIDAANPGPADLLGDP
jgi:hypothetical protein